MGIWRLTWGNQNQQRRASMRVCFSALREMLLLPDGVEIHDVRVSPTKVDAIEISLIGEGLPERCRTVEGCEVLWIEPAYNWYEAGNITWKGWDVDGP